MPYGYLIREIVGLQTILYRCMWKSCHKHTNWVGLQLVSHPLYIVEPSFTVISIQLLPPLPATSNDLKLPHMVCNMTFIAHHRFVNSEGGCVQLQCIKLAIDRTALLIYTKVDMVYYAWLAMKPIEFFGSVPACEWGAKRVFLIQYRNSKPSTCISNFDPMQRPRLSRASIIISNFPKTDHN